MSWIEVPDSNNVGNFDLSKLRIDEAYLNFTSKVQDGVSLWLYKLSKACFSCPYRRVKDFPVLVNNVAADLTLDTLFPTKFRLRTNGDQEFIKENDDDESKFCDIDHSFGEFGVYNIYATGTATSPECEVETAAKPVNIYYPLLLALFFYILLFLVIFGVRKYLKRGKLSQQKISQQATGSTGNANGVNQESTEKYHQTSSQGSQPPQVSTESLINNSGSSDTKILVQQQTVNNMGNGSCTNNTNSLEKKESHENGSSNPTNAITSKLSSNSNNGRSQQRTRLRSLDTFRGMCIVVMIFVNDGGARYYFFEHAIWDGLYVADLVFPWFLWIMGVCIPISIKSQIRKGIPRLKIWKSIIMRSIKLIGLGIIHNSTYGVIQFGEGANLRIPGVLQRFGICYFVCASLVLFGMSVNFRKPENSKLRAILQDIEIIWKGWIPVLIILGIHFALTFGLDVPGCPRGYMGPGGLSNNREANATCIGGAAGYIDQKILTIKHIYNWPTAKGIYDSGAYDPEGILGTLTSIFQVWLGVQTGGTMLVFPRASSRLKRWGAWAVVHGVIAGILCHAKETGGWISVNKNLWSISFVLVTCSFALVLLSFLYFVIDMKKWWSGTPFFEPGMNSILLYVGHSTFNSALPWNWAIGPMRTHAIKLVESLWGTSLWVIIAIRLHHLKTYWSV